VVADFHIGDMASVWKPTPTFSEGGVTAFAKPAT